MHPCTFVTLIAVKMDSTLQNYRKICSRATLQEKKEGFFQSLAEALSERVDIDIFAKFTTDFERVKYVATTCWNYIGAELIYRGKKLEEAVAMRQKGNTFFTKGDLPKALLCYSQSLVQCPVGPELVSVYANRSALFQKMGEHELSITDAELAISYGAPENTRHKIYERMASCYVATKNYHKAKVILRLAKHFSEKYDKDNVKFGQKLEKLSKAIQLGGDSEPKISNKCQSQNTSNDNKENISTPKFKPDNKFTSASQKFDVKHSAGLGRFAYAKKNIQVGEEILREKPFASCISIDRMGTHCLHCLQRLKAPIACDTCANVGFCSRECKKLGDVYHQYECRVMSLLIGSGMSLNALLALRIITQSSLQEFKKIIPNLGINPESVPTYPDGKYDTSYMSIYNLGGLEDQRPPEELLHRTIMAIFLVKCLRLVGYFELNLFKNPHPSVDEFHIAALILRNLQVLQFNAYEVCEFLMPDRKNYKKSVTFSVGLAIYPTASYFNHSCSPDVARYFIGTTLVSTAMNSIPANQPIFDNYGPNFIKVPRDERRLKLNGRYWFHCSCDACMNNWETLNKMEVELEPKTPEEAQTLKKLQKLEPLFEKAVKFMENAKPENALECLIKYIGESEILLAPYKDSSFYPYKTVVLANQAMQLCYCSLGTVHLATKVEDK